MSRIGKKAIEVPDKVVVTLSGNKVTVKGPKGQLENTFSEYVAVRHDKEAKSLVVETTGVTREHNAHHGLWRALINNMVVGVSTGFIKELEIVGTGYRAKLAGTNLAVTIGFTHDVIVPIPAGLNVAVPAPTQIIISGCNKCEVGQLAANIRKIRPPDPYKGKGIRYKGETVRKLVGKTFGSGG